MSFDSGYEDTLTLYKRLVVLLLVVSGALALSLVILLVRPLAPHSAVNAPQEFIQSAQDIDDQLFRQVSPGLAPQPLPTPQAFPYTPLPTRANEGQAAPKVIQKQAVVVEEEIIDIPKAPEQPEVAEPTPQPKAAPEIQRQPVDWTKQNVVPANPAWLKNALPFTPQDGKPMIVIIIDDMGVNRHGSADMVKLPGPLTLSYLPYAEDLQAQAAEARAKGHELMLHQPMQPMRETANPGPNVLKTTLPDSENLNRLMLGLSSFEGFVGVNNHMGSRFTSNSEALSPIVREIARRGYLFLDSKTIQDSQGDKLAATYGLPALKRDVFLDHYEGLSDVRNALRQMERVAFSQGYAIAIGHPKSATALALKEWLPTLESKGLQLAPITAVAKALAPVSNDPFF